MYMHFLKSEKRTCNPHTRILVSRKLAQRRRYDLRPEVLIKPAKGHTSQRAQGPKRKATEYVLFDMCPARSCDRGQDHMPLLLTVSPVASQLTYQTKTVNALFDEREADVQSSHPHPRQPKTGPTEAF